MAPKNPLPVTPASGFERDLFKLELLVARRADRLNKAKGSRRGHDLEHWLQAEREVFQEKKRRIPTAATAPA